MANVLKTIFGLLTIVLMTTAMIPFAAADFDAPVADRKLVETVFVVVDDPTSEIPLTWAINMNDNDANDNTVDIYVEDEIVASDIDVPERNGGVFFTEVLTLNDLENVIVDDDEVYKVVITQVGVAPNPLTDLLTDYITIIIVPELVNTINPAMFKLDKLVDQTGKKDELNPGDSFTAYIEIDASEDGNNKNGNTEGMVYHNMRLVGKLYDTVTKEYYGSDETKSFTLGDETEVVKELSFQIPRQLELSNDKEDDRLELVIEVSANEQTFNDQMKGYTTLNGAINDDFLLDLEANEDSLYISEVSVSDTEVNAGDSISVSAEVCNDGVETQNNVKVVAELVGLNVKYENGIVELANNDCVTWAAGLAVPTNAKAGTYDLKVSVKSEEGATDFMTKQITIAGTTTDKEVSLTADEDELDVAGKTEFTLTLKNDGAERKAFDIEVEGAEWANVDFDETVTVEAGEEKDFTVAVTPKSGETGEKEFTVFAKADGEVVSADLTANLADTSIIKGEVVKVLQWVFAVIIIVAIILVIVWAVTKGRNAEGDKKDVYY